MSLSQLIEAIHDQAELHFTHGKQMGHIRYRLLRSITHNDPRIPPWKYVLASYDQKRRELQ